MAEETTLVDDILERYKYQQGYLIPMMQDIQAKCDYLPRDMLEYLAEKLHVPLSQTYNVATFYSSFSLVPRGRHLLTLCLGTVCYLKGAGQIAEVIQKELNVELGGTSPDRRFTFRRVNCLGACALAPVMVIDGKYYGKVTPEQVSEILAEYEDSGEE